jgi:parallel beta-helix repeat protein
MSWVRSLAKYKFLLIALSLLLVSTQICGTHPFFIKAPYGTIVVPDDYATIQAAINAADPGETIFVRSGTYFEQLVIDKAVRLVGEHPETTTIRSGDNVVISVKSDGVEVANFTVKTDVGSVAVYASSASNCSIINNKIFSSYTGVRFEHANNSVFRNNFLEKNRKGIDLENWSYGIIQDNIFINNTQAIWMVSSSYNTICSNTIVDPVRAGIMLEDSSNYNVVYGNNISRFLGDPQISNEGVTILQSSYNRIYKNLVTKITWACNVEIGSYNMIYKNRVVTNGKGLTMGLSSYNEFYSNHVEGNEIGLYLSGPCMHNLVHHNNFINNEQQCFHSHDYPDYLDDGYPSGGNYWSDYNGTDEFSGQFQNETGSDGIGDMPYKITEVNVDHYPLMSPAKIFEATTPEPMPSEIELISNSTISNFEADMNTGAIRFTVSGDTGIGYCRITIPNTIVYGMWGGNYSVLVDGVDPLRVENWTDNTNTYVYFTYHHSTHEVTIVPESPLMAILPLMASTIAAILYRRKQRR